MILTKRDNQTKSLPTLFEQIFGTSKNDVFNFFPDFIGTSHMNKGFPAVNTKKDDEKYEIDVAIPGMDKSDFSINLEDGVLTISSKKQTSIEDKKEDYMRREFSYSSFTRSFTIPEDANGEKISAKYENGILKIELPRIEIAKKSPKLIEVL